jgi:hypothetical protein
VGVIGVSWKDHGDLALEIELQKTYEQQIDPMAIADGLRTEEASWTIRAASVLVRSLHSQDPIRLQLFLLLVVSFQETSSRAFPSLKNPLGQRNLAILAESLHGVAS